MLYVYMYTMEAYKYSQCVFLWLLIPCGSACGEEANIYCYSTVMVEILSNRNNLMFRFQRKRSFVMEVLFFLRLEKYNVYMELLRWVLCG